MLSYDSAPRFVRAFAAITSPMRVVGKYDTEDVELRPRRHRSIVLAKKIDLIRRHISKLMSKVAETV